MLGHLGREGARGRRRSHVGGVAEAGTRRSPVREIDHDINAVELGQGDHRRARATKLAGLDALWVTMPPPGRGWCSRRSTGQEVPAASAWPPGPPRLDLLGPGQPPDLVQGSAAERRWASAMVVRPRRRRAAFAVTLAVRMSSRILRASPRPAGGWLRPASGRPRPAGCPPAGAVAKERELSPGQNRPPPRLTELDIGGGVVDRGQDVARPDPRPFLDGQLEDLAGDLGGNVNLDRFDRSDAAMTFLSDLAAQARPLRATRTSARDLDLMTRLPFGHEQGRRQGRGSPGGLCR